jgi:hypothetical protein
MSIVISGLDETVTLFLTREAEKRQMSLEDYAKLLIESQVSASSNNPISTDLDALAGTWSNEDADEFERNTNAFRQVDTALWK